MIPTNTPVRPRGAGAEPLAVAASAGRQTAYPTYGSSVLCLRQEGVAEGGRGLGAGRERGAFTSTGGHWQASQSLTQCCSRRHLFESRCSEISSFTEVVQSATVV